MQLRSAAASALCNRNPQTAMAWRTVCPQGRPAPCSPPVHRKISLCVEARCSFVTHSTGTSAAHAVEARRRRRSRCGRCASVSPAGQHKLTRVRFVRPRVPDALEASPLIHKQSLLRIHKHVPETLIVHSSALEPLLAVGIGVPEPQSLRYGVWPPGAPCRAPPPCSPKPTYRNAALNNPLWLLCMMAWPAAGAAHGVHSAEGTDLRCNAMQMRVSSSVSSCRLEAADHGQADGSDGNWPVARHGMLGRPRVRSRG